MNLNDTVTSLIRTWIPIAVGYAVAILADWEITANADALEAAATPIVMGAYYLAVRVAEQIHPVFGWLLGRPKTPTYRQGA